MPAIVGTLGYLQFDYINPILGLHLVETTGMSEQQVGLFFCIAPAFYLAGSLIVTKVGSKKIEKKTWMIFGAVMSFPA